MKKRKEVKVREGKSTTTPKVKPKPEKGNEQTVTPQSPAGKS